MMIDEPLFDAAVFAKMGIYRMDGVKRAHGNGSWVASCPSDAPSVLFHSCTELSDTF